MREGLSAFELHGEPHFWWYSLGRRARCRGEREEWRKGGSQGKNVNCNQAAQHVRSWTTSTQCQPGMRTAPTIPSWASESGRHRARPRARTATHLGAQLRKTKASGHRRRISGYSHLIPPWNLLGLEAIVAEEPSYYKPQSCDVIPP